MKPTVLEFVGGHWDGKVLRTDSNDYEEQLLAAGCYEMSHRGAVGTACVGLSYDAMIFSRRHRWTGAEEVGFCENHRYRVAERQETEALTVIRFEYRPV